MYDAIVVGARCAGSPTAMLLARKGYRVLMVDRALFPSDTLSTHALRPEGAQKLKRWGLLARVAATNCPPVTGVLFDFGAGPMPVAMPPFEDIEATYAPRRTVLDNILVEAAVEAGVELREGFTVDEVVTEDGRVTGLRGRSRKGAAATETAPIVIGADGVHSFVARAVGAPIVREVPGGTCAYYGYFANVPADGYEIYFRERRYILLFPTNDGEVCIAMEWPREEFNTFRQDVEGNFLRTLELAPGLAERVKGAVRTEKLMGSGDLPNFFRKAWGPGWALVGDAGYHKDPILGSGITDAFYEAEYLAEAVHRGLSGAEPMDQALATYEAHRDAWGKDVWERTERLVRFPSPMEALNLFVGAPVPAQAV